MEARAGREVPMQTASPIRMQKNVSHKRLLIVSMRSFLRNQILIQPAFGAENGEIVSVRSFLENQILIFAKF